MKPGLNKRFVAHSYIRDRRQEKERRSEEGVRGGQRESQPPTARRPEPLKEGMMTTENGTLGQKKKPDTAAKECEKREASRSR